MKLIIAGSRHLKISIEDIASILAEKNLKPTHIVSGGAKGIDKSGELFAKSASLPILLYPANWNKFGKKAGPIRNREMAKIADAAVIIWDGVSVGSLHMINCMKQLNKPVYVYILDDVDDYE